MKKIILLLMMMNGLKSFSSDPIKPVNTVKQGPSRENVKTLHHEFGVDLYPVLIDIFKPDINFGFGGVPQVKPLYNFSYKYHFNQWAVRSRFHLLNNNQDTNTYKNTNGQFTYISTVYPILDHSYYMMLGGQYNINKNKIFQLFGAMDLIMERKSSSSGNAYAQYDSTISYVTIQKSYSTMSMLTKTKGIQLSIGASMRLNQNLYITFESSMRFLKSDIENSFMNGSYTYQWDRINNPIINTSDLVNDNKTKSSANSFIPVGNLTLAYRF